VFWSIFAGFTTVALGDRHRFLKQAAILFFCLTFVFPLFGQEQDAPTLALREEIDRGSKANPSVVTSLLGAGADPNGIFDTWYNKTFLMKALDSRNNQVAQILFERGADPYILTKDGENAAFYGNREGKELRGSWGVRFDITDNRGTSPLMNHPPSWDARINMFILEWEEKHSPNFSARFESRKEYLTYMLGRALGASYISRDEIATYYAFVERLIDAGADPAAQHDKGFPVAYIAVRENRDTQFLIPLLVERGAPLNAHSGEGLTMLWCAAAEGNDELLDFLLRKGADPNLQCRSGVTPLMAAQTVGALNALLKAGANPNVQDNEGETLLMKIRRHQEFIEPLLKAGADPTIKDNEGQTVMHHWTRLLEDEALLDDLIARGCLINEQDNEGYPPLMYASRYRYPKTVDALLKRGADPNLRGPVGRTALHLYLLRVEDFNTSSYRDENYEPIPASLLAAGARPTDTDDEGDSALKTVMRLSEKHSQMIPLRDMVTQYVDDDEEIKLATAAAKKIIRKEAAANFSRKLFPSLMAFSVPLLIGGVSIGMREGVYKDNPSENFMGPVNGFLTLASTGLFLGGFTGLAIAKENNAGLGGLLNVFIGGTLGLIGGIVVVCLPKVREAFKDIPVLYYAPTAISVIGVTIVIFNIWRY
jgi:ankyrin repeat protein